MKRVLCIYAGKSRTPGGCEIYRGNMPLHHLGKQPGWQTGWAFFDNLFEQGAREGSGFWYGLLREVDLIVFPRLAVPDDEGPRSAMADLFYVARQFGTRIVYETDDDYTNTHRFVTEHDAILTANWSDAITVTTRYLAEKLQQQGVDRPIHILPNCIDPANWRDSKPPIRHPAMRNKLLIALTGSESHKADWIVLKDVMPQILEEFPQVHFLVMGYQPEYLDNLPNTTYSGGVRYDVYARTIRGCDIILAPVDPNDGFNLGKSPIKAVEGMAARRDLNGKPAGAVVVATDNPIYRIAIQHNQTGILVEHTPERWLEALRTLILETDRRHRLQLNGHRWVYAHLDISKEWRRWADAYRKILASPSNNSVKLPTTLLKGQPS